MGCRTAPYTTECMTMKILPGVKVGTGKGGTGKNSAKKFQITVICTV